MFRSTIAFTALGTLLLSLSSCSTMNHLLQKRLGKSSKTAVPREPKNQIIGTIEMINPEQHFVLVKTSYRMALSPGTKLETLAANGLKAVLTVTPEHKMNFISADITEGFPQQGDTVILPATIKPPDAAVQPGGDQPPPLDNLPPIVDLPLPLNQLPPPITPSGT